ncbi:DUF805 domain-containing protein [Brevundimonas sp. NPDC092305]|uniref:DUF805 domain-containing protein n=1 Tax=Brevundimonas sp. NPDC092305 TaxID=3363957 RepID=UPI0038095E2B
MSNPLTHGFRNLTRFSGRDRRGLFWPHAAIVFILVFAVISIGMTFVITRMFGDTQSFAVANPDAVTIQSSSREYSMQVDPGYAGAPGIPEFKLLFAVVTGGVVLAIILLAAAVSRRLHDTGRAAWWGLVPAAFLGVCICLYPMAMQDMITSPTPNFALFGAGLVSGMIYNVTLVILIVMLALPGRLGPNRYGPMTV